jgi:HD-GYP domain-containing protein (c-di-GMP phosphodiesterase class II)
MNADIPNIQDFIRHLLSAIANASLYGMEHPQVTRLSSQAFDNISSTLENGPGFTLMVVENELVIDGQPQDLSLFMGRFTQILKSRGVGTIRFLPGITKAEVNALISGLARQQNESGGLMNSSEHLRLGRVEVRQGEDGNTVDETAHRIKIPDMPKEELARFMEVYESVKQKKKLKVNGMIEVVSGFVEVFRQEGKPLLVMAALRDTDEYTFTHSTNVCILNLAQAMALGIDGQLLNDIGVAAMLHDIGKLYIPEEILTKTDKLTPEEFEIMKQHPVTGARHLLETPGVPRLAAIAAYEHHLKFNLTGYPKVSGDWPQNLCSHMTMISDFFDALRTRRSYREPVELQKIAAMMQDMMGTDLHPALTRNFLKIISGLVEKTG